MSRLETEAEVVSTLPSLPTTEGERVTSPTEEPTEAIPETLEELLQMVQEEATAQRKARAQRKAFWIALAVIYSTVLLIFLWRGIVKGEWDDSLNMMFQVFFFGSFGGAAVSQTYLKATTKLAQFDDVRCVGPWAEMLHWGDWEQKARAHEALTRLLPRLRASDAALLTAEQRHCLNREFHAGSQALKCAVLQAYGEIGGTKERETIAEWLERAKHEAAILEANQIAWNPSLLEAAEDCLAKMDVRLEQQRLSATLLRPSSATEAQETTTLLRAATPTQETSPEQLLRIPHLEETTDTTKGETA